MPRIPWLILLALQLTLVGTAYAQTTSPKTKKPDQLVTRNAGTPTTAETTYRNPEFAFSYKIPYAWVDRTAQMRDDSDPSQSKLLLAVFQRPPEAVGDTVNSAIVITTESAASYPGLKTAADYLGPLTEIARSKGFRAATDPYEYFVGATTLVRADFIKDLGKLTMRQTSLLLLRRKFVISFTFITGTEDEIDELIERLHFEATKSK